MNRILLFAILVGSCCLLNTTTLAQCSNPPTISTPIVNSVTETTATIGATIDFNGGGSGCDASYEMRYSTTTPVGASNPSGAGITNNDGVPFTAAIAGLTAGTKYYYKGYSSNSSGNVQTADDGSVFFYTRASAPGSFLGTLDATVNGNNIDLDFGKASQLPLNAHGYIVLRRVGSNPDLSGISDGTAQSSPYYLATINDSTDIDFTDNTALGGVSYRYALVPYRVVDDGGIIASTYNYGALSPIATASVPLVTTIDEITGGIAPSPLNSSATTQAILGFSISSNGTPNFTAINIAVTSSALNKFSNTYLYESANNSFGGDSPVGSVSDNLTGTQIQLSDFNVALSSTPKYFFIVVDVQDTVSATSPTLTPSFTNANITISGGGTVTVNSSPLTGDTYSFADTAPPTIASTTPADNATGISVLLNQLSITFNEPITYVGDNSNEDNMIRVREISVDYIDTIEVADVSVVGNTVTFLTDAPFGAGKNYTIRIGNSVFEDAVGNPFVGILTGDNTTWNFTIESAPNISSLSTGTRCIGDQLTITGSRFTGTGGSGNTKPFVFINGVQVPPADVTAFSSTSITLTVPTGATTGNVTVQNQDNLLTSNGSALTVRPQINTGLTVTPATLNPAQNTNVNIDILGTQDNNYTYTLILIAAPVGYSITPVDDVDTEVGNNGTRTVNTSPTQPGDNLSETGDYTYRIDVSRTGCTTRTLSNTPFTLNVAEIGVTASATDTIICVGESTTLIGSTSGGTGFYQFSWTSDPVGYTSANSSPTVSPTVNTRYYLTLTDDEGGTSSDFVDIVVNPVTAATIIPAPTESVVRTNYTIENRDYRLYGDPVGGSFSGQGVTLKNDGFYYFNPFNAGVGNRLITYTYTNAFGCSDQDSKMFRVIASAVDGLELSYCNNRTTDSPLTYNVANFPSGYQFTRLVFYHYNFTSGVYCTAEATPEFPFCGTANPLTVNSTVTVPDIQAGVTLLPGAMLTRPASYTLNLDVIRNTYGYSSDNSFYILVYGKDAFGFETYVTLQYFTVNENGLPPTIIGIDENENICSDTAPITLSSSVLGYTVSNFSITPGTFSSSLSGTNNRNFDPDDNSLNGAIERALTITMSYSDYNNCPSSVVRNFNWVNKPGAPIANDSAYCQIVNGQPAKFYLDAAPTVSPSNPYWYELDPVIIPDRIANPVLDSINFKGFVAPGVDGSIATIKEFFVTQNFRGCEGSYKKVQLIIKPAPEANISNTPICDGQDFTLFGSQASPGVPYLKYDWDLGDGTIITVNNDSTLIYNYGPGKATFPFNIKLTITNSQGCNNTDNLPITVGSNPVLNAFNYEQVCENDLTEFTTTPGQIQIASYEWDFGDGSPIIGPGNFPDIDHTFPGVGTYSVNVTLRTPAECFSVETKEITILEYLSFDSDNPYQMNNLNGGNGFWSVEDLNGNTSWQFAPPATMLMDDFASSAWITNPAGNYLPNEYSFVNSPCLNIQNIQRPVLSLDYILNTDENRDGVVLEFSKDGGVNWLPLGNTNSGLNWFNTPAFFTGVIGNSTIGWSGDSWNLADNILNDTLVQGKRALDNLPALTFAERTKVRFRIAFKTDGTRELEGFGFNNLNIESRNRFLLVENFTNESASRYSANNSAFKLLPATDIVKLQYHLPFGDDSINPDNQADPGSRAAYYGITNDPSIFPRVYVDGVSNGDFTTPPGWFANYSSLRSLKTSPFEITISTAPSANQNELTLSVDARALDDITLPAYRKPILQIAIIEKVAGNNEFVVRKLLPNAAGTELALPIAQDEIVSVGPIVWSSTLADPGDIAIIAFIQDEVTKEVYQAALLTNPANLPTIITGTETTFTDRLMIYPNPAKDVLNIKLPEVVKQLTPIQMIDNVGRVVYDGAFKIGEQTKTINTTELSNGFYLLKVQAANGEVALKKVIITHSN